MQKLMKINIFIIIISFLINIKLQTKTIIQKSHFAGSWYAGNKITLNQQIDQYLNIAKNNFNAKINSNSIKAIIVPHAGYYYSGICAASVYQIFLNNTKKK